MRICPQSSVFKVFLTAKGTSLNVEATGPWDMNVFMPRFFQIHENDQFFFLEDLQQE